MDASQEIMDERIIIDVARLEKNGAKISGEADIIDIDEEFVKPFGGVRYNLIVKVFGTELLVKGQLEQDFDLVCSRCGCDFDTTIKVEDFVVSVEINEKTEYIDLTNDARECIILALPSFPVCDESCPGVVRESEKAPDDRWSALDGLKIEEKK